jgi:pyrroline-5-carboxylate reductase
MSALDLIKTKKIGILGCGNLGQSVLRAFIESNLVPKTNLYITNRIEKKSEKVAQELGVNALHTNEELVEICDVVIIGVKPQDLYQTIEPIASSFHDGHTVMCLAAGISLDSLEELLPEVVSIVRVMPNTAARVKTSVIAYAATDAASAQMAWIKPLLETMGYVVPVEDGEMMEALTVGASSGIGFIFELMIYWKEWLEERGIDPDIAKKITIQVFSGASKLAEETSNTSLEELQRKVTSLKGVTAAGLDSMRELEIERALRYSFEKAAMRDKELGKGWQKDGKS